MQRNYLKITALAISAALFSVCGYAQNQAATEWSVGQMVMVTPVTPADATQGVKTSSSSVIAPKVYVNSQTIVTLPSPVCPAVQPATAQTLTCPTGQVGLITQTRTNTCDGTTGWVWQSSAWTTTSNTCAPAAAADCITDSIVIYSQPNKNYECTFTPMVIEDVSRNIYGNNPNVIVATSTRKMPYAPNYFWAAAGFGAGDAICKNGVITWTTPRKCVSLCPMGQYCDP